MTIDETTTKNLWSADDIDEIAKWLATRQSRLWRLTNPQDVAEWVFADPEPAPIDPAPAELDTDWRDGLTGPQQAAWALAGWFLRMTVPEAARTAGTHWLLSDRVEDGQPILRLTVGTLETIGIHLASDGVWLRLHAAPVEHAFDAGVLHPDETARRGIVERDDSTKTLAGEKYLVSCPDIETALWLLRQPPVITAARMLSAWTSAGPFSFESSYRPEVAARAWHAAETLVGS
ncbi:MAG TPA: hypothetical protein VFX61_10255 [Micromonosporaceae bacterium]|nr:hypothetical protein [Micromonosporaceae bacterium]